MKISIFIPIYNGKAFIARTLDCLLAQNFNNFEILCVDDSSTDASFSILQQYAAYDTRIKIFQKSNGGDVPHSWEFITPHLNGEFTLYMSQDDLLEPNTLELLVKRQQETNADVVIPTVVWYKEGEIIDSPYNHYGVNGNTKIILNGKDAFELMMDYSISGFGIWRTSIVKAHPVIPRAYNSDEYSQRDWCSRCTQVAFSDGKFLYSQDNPQAITHQFTDKQLEASLTDAMVVKRAIEMGISKDRIIQYTNTVYQRLWFHTMWFMVHRHTLTRQRCHALYKLFSQAYHEMHNYTTLSNWKYKYSSINLLFFWIIIVSKTLKAKYAK